MRIAAVTITLSATERRELESPARRHRTARGLARRARIMLADELGDGAGLELGQALELAVDRGRHVDRAPDGADLLSGRDVLRMVGRTPA